MIIIMELWVEHGMNVAKIWGQLAEAVSLTRSVKQLSQICTQSPYDFGHSSLHSHDLCNCLHIKAAVEVVAPTPYPFMEGSAKMQAHHWLKYGSRFLNFLFTVIVMNALNKCRDAELGGVARAFSHSPNPKTFLACLIALFE